MMQAGGVPYMQDVLLKRVKLSFEHCSARVRQTRGFSVGAMFQNRNGYYEVLRAATRY